MKLKSLIILLLASIQAFGQTNVPISQLPAASTLTGSELLWISQGGHSVRTTTQGVANLAGASTAGYGVVISGGLIRIDTSKIASLYAAQHSTDTTGFGLATRKQLIDTAAALRSAIGTGGGGASYPTFAAPSGFSVTGSGTSAITISAPGNSSTQYINGAGGASLVSGLPVSTSTQTALDGKAALTHTHAESDVTGLVSDLSGKQAALVSGTNIKTVNGTSLLGSGNLVVSGGTAIDTTSLSARIDNKVDKVNGKALSTEDYTTTEKTKLAGISAGATVNSSDATLLNRANHTGAQLASTISDFTTSGRGLISLTTTGSGAATYNSSTGVINVPTPTGGGGAVSTSPTREVVYISETFPGSSLPATMGPSTSAPTYTVSSNKIHFTGSGSASYLDGSGSKFLIHSTPVLCESNSLEADITIDATPSSSTKGISIGYTSMNAGVPVSVAYGIVTDATSGNYGKTFAYSLYQTTYVYSDSAKTNLNNGDVLHIEVLRKNWTTSIIVTNVTQNWVNRQDIIDSYNGQTPIFFPNTAFPTIWHLGGNLSIGGFKYTIHAPAHTDIFIIGNSITYGNIVTRAQDRWVEQIGDRENNIWGGGAGDLFTSHLKHLVNEIIAVAPKRALFYDPVGNDVNNGLPWTAAVLAFRDTLKNHSIETIWCNGHPRNTVNESEQPVFFNAGVRDDRIIHTWETEALGTRLNPLFDAGDGVHLGILGHRNTANTINYSLGYPTKGLTVPLADFSGGLNGNVYLNTDDHSLYYRIGTISYKLVGNSILMDQLFNTPGDVFVSLGLGGSWSQSKGLTGDTIEIRNGALHLGPLAGSGTAIYLNPAPFSTTDHIKITVYGAAPFFAAGLGLTVGGFATPATTITTGKYVVDIPANTLPDNKIILSGAGYILGIKVEIIP